MDIFSYFLLPLRNFLIDESALTPIPHPKRGKKERKKESLIRARHKDNCYRKEREGERRVFCPVRSEAIVFKGDTTYAAFPEQKIRRKKVGFLSGSISSFYLKILRPHTQGIFFLLPFRSLGVTNLGQYVR